MNSICLSVAANLRCQALSRTEQFILVAPAAVEFLFFPFSLSLARHAHRTRWLLVLDGLIFPALAAADVVAHLIPALYTSFNVFAPLDTALAAASALPIALYTLFLVLFARTHLVPQALPPRIARVAAPALIATVAPTVAFAALAAVLGLAHTIVRIPGQTPDAPSRIVLAIGFTSPILQRLSLFFGAAALALLVLLQALLFSLAFFRIARGLLDEHRIANKAKHAAEASEESHASTAVAEATGPEEVHRFRGLPYIALGLKLGAIEALVGILAPAFAGALARRVLRLFARGCLVAGIIKGLDTLDDFDAFDADVRARRAEKQQGHGVQTFVLEKGWKDDRWNGRMEGWDEYGFPASIRGSSRMSGSTAVRRVSKESRPRLSLSLGGNNSNSNKYNGPGYEYGVVGRASVGAGEPRSAPAPRTGFASGGLASGSDAVPPSMPIPPLVNPWDNPRSAPLTGSGAAEQRVTVQYDKQGRTPPVLDVRFSMLSLGIPVGSGGSPMGDGSWRRPLSQQQQHGRVVLSALLEDPRESRVSGGEHSGDGDGARVHGGAATGTGPTSANMPSQPVPLGNAPPRPPRSPYRTSMPRASMGAGYTVSAAAVAPGVIRASTPASDLDVRMPFRDVTSESEASLSRESSRSIRDDEDVGAGAVEGAATASFDPVAALDSYRMTAIRSTALPTPITTPSATPRGRPASSVYSTPTSADTIRPSWRPTSSSTATVRARRYSQRHSRRASQQQQQQQQPTPSTPTRPGTRPTSLFSVHSGSAVSRYSGVTIREDMDAMRALVVQFPFPRAEGSEGDVDSIRAASYAALAGRRTMGVGVGVGVGVGAGARTGMGLGMGEVGYPYVPHPYAYAPAPAPSPDPFEDQQQQQPTPITPNASRDRARERRRTLIPPPRANTIASSSSPIPNSGPDWGPTPTFPTSAPPTPASLSLSPSRPRSARLKKKKKTTLRRRSSVVKDLDGDVGAEPTLVLPTPLVGGKEKSHRETPGLVITIPRAGDIGGVGSVVGNGGRDDVGAGQGQGRSGHRIQTVRAPRTPRVERPGVRGSVNLSMRGEVGGMGMGAGVAGIGAWGR